MSHSDFPAYHPDTLAVRAGIERTPFGEHGDAMYLTSRSVPTSITPSSPN